MEHSLYCPQFFCFAQTNEKLTTNQFVSLGWGFGASGCEDLV